MENRQRVGALVEFPRLLLELGQDARLQYEAGDDDHGRQWIAESDGGLRGANAPEKAAERHQMAQNRNPGGKKVSVRSGTPSRGDRF